MKKDPNTWCEVENAKHVQKNLPIKLKPFFNPELILLLLYKHHEFIVHNSNKEIEQLEKSGLKKRTLGNDLYPSLLEFLEKFNITLSFQDLDEIFKLSDEYTDNFDWSEFEEEENEMI